LPQEPWKILKIYPVTPDPLPTQPKKPEKPVANPAGQDVLAPPVTPIRPQTGDSPLTVTTGETGMPGGTGGTVQLPPLGADPVFKGAQINPRYAGALQPVYPPGMIREEREGVVTVRVLVGIDGRVKALEAVRADAPTFLETTRKQALSKWRFLPATRDGEPVESWREMTVRFELPDEMTVRFELPDCPTK
jgi:protein TonB